MHRHIYTHTHTHLFTHMEIAIDSDTFYAPTPSYSFFFPLNNISWKSLHVSEYKWFHLNISLYCLKLFHVKLFYTYTSHLPSQKENGNSSRAGVITHPFSFPFLYSLVFVHLLHISLFMLWEIQDVYFS